MATAKTLTFKAELRPRIRVLREGDIVLGPGKIELLECVAKTNSLNQAAKSMGMSYMKAWLLVGIMNRSYKKPLLKMERGGAEGGGTELTETGKKVLSLYRQMHQASLRAVERPWKEMRKLLK